MAPEAAVLMGCEGLDDLITALHHRGYRVRGPVVRDGAILPGDLASSRDLPLGHHDVQGPGHYGLRVDPQDDEAFGWAVGPGSWKTEFLPPRLELWRAASTDGGSVSITEPADHSMPVAIVGARPCEIAALAVQDEVLARGAVADPTYRRRRAECLVVAAECGRPAATCFCQSMGTGPMVEEGFDIALTELPSESGRRYLARSGSDAGRAVLAGLGRAEEATAADWAARASILEQAQALIRTEVRVDGLPELLAQNQGHPRWEQVAERCLACGNCTLACPTCFCTAVEDTTELGGDSVRSRRWASCFEGAHSYIHGGPVRAGRAARYRQWATHKFSTWWDQYGSSGCVGCGRCVTWCPAGIDVTAELRAISETDGARA